MEPPTLDSIQSALSAVARGAFAVVVDDADRENEGDLIGASALATRASLALMLRHSSGVVCASVSAAPSRANHSAPSMSILTKRR